MTRAFMSDPRLPSKVREDCGNADTIADVAEAEHILAETEPAALRETAPISVPDYMVCLERAEPADGVLYIMRMVLAESLRAFVEEE